MTLAATPRQAAVMLRRVVAVTAADAEMVRCAYCALPVSHTMKQDSLAEPK